MPACEWFFRFEGTNHKRHKKDHKKEQGKDFCVTRLYFLVFLARFYAKRIPLLAEEGNARLRKCREANAAAQTGWSDRHPLDFAELTTN